MGLVSLQQTATALDALLVNHDSEIDSEQAYTLINTLREDQQLLHKGLQQISIPTSTAKTVEETTPARVREVLDHLEKLLAEDNTAANELILDCKEILKEEYGSIVEQLQQQIEAFDYFPALTTLRTLVSSSPFSNQ